MGAKDLAENKNFFVKHTLIEPENYEENIWGKSKAQLTKKKKMRSTTSPIPINFQHHNSYMTICVLPHPKNPFFLPLNLLLKK